MTPHTQTRAWSYPEDHLFFRASPNARRRPYPRSTSTSVRLRDVEDPVYENASSYTRMKGPSAMEFFRRILPLWKGKEKKDDKDLGKLEKAQDMPYDVLYEIFSHLHPLDLLVLSRTSRALRKLLLDRSSVSLWRTSLAGVRALPFCPNDLTEVQYANLAFDDSCHFCLTSGVEKILWICRVRCCAKCIKKEFISQSELESRIPEDVFVERPESLFPYILPCNGSNESERGQPLYLLSKVTQYLDELAKIIPTQDDTALAIWSERKRLIQAEKLTHAALCEYWSEEWTYSRPARGNIPYVNEVCIVLSLLLLLSLLWREHTLSFAMQAATVISVFAGGDDSAYPEL